MTEINEYNPENDEINVQDIYQWRADGDRFENVGRSNKLEDIKFDRGWSQERLEDELLKRRTVLAYLIDKSLNTYAQVAGTIQAFMADQDSILTLIANDALGPALDDLREMESVSIDVPPEKEEMITRFDPSEQTKEAVEATLEEARTSLLPEYEEREVESESIKRALQEAVDEQQDIDLDAETRSETGSSGTEEEAESDTGHAERDGTPGEDVDTSDPSVDKEDSEPLDAEGIGDTGNLGKGEPDDAADVFDGEEPSESEASGDLEEGGELGESEVSEEKGEFEESAGNEVADLFDEDENAEAEASDSDEIAELFGDDDAT